MRLIFLEYVCGLGRFLLVFVLILMVIIGKIFGGLKLSVRYKFNFGSKRISFLLFLIIGIMIIIFFSCFDFYKIIY